MKKPRIYFSCVYSMTRKLISDKWISHVQHMNFAGWKTILNSYVIHPSQNWMKKWFPPKNRWKPGRARFTVYCVTPILAVNPVDQTASFPPYLISSISIAEYLAKAKPPLSFEAESPLLKILDLVVVRYSSASTTLSLTWPFFSISAGRSSASHTVCSGSMSSWNYLSNDCSGWKWSQLGYANWYLVPGMRG